jgi:hypothetical protein
MNAGYEYCMQRPSEELRKTLGLKALFRSENGD